MAGNEAERKESSYALLRLNNFAPEDSLNVLVMLLRRLFYTQNPGMTQMG